MWTIIKQEDNIMSRSYYDYLSIYSFGRIKETERDIKTVRQNFKKEELKTELKKESTEHDSNSE